MKKIKFKEVQNLLDGGKQPEEIFNRCDYCDYISKGLRRVGLNNKWNYIDKNNKLLSNIWFDECHIFVNGYARVQLNEKWNYIKLDGELLSDIWFDWCDDFFEGIATVKIDTKEYKIDEDGKVSI